MILWYIQRQDIYHNCRRNILIGIVGARVLGMAMETSGNFRLRRILVWLNPEKYASEGGYQIMQALYAIGSGGFFGKGLGTVPRNDHSRSSE